MIITPFFIAKFFLYSILGQQLSFKRNHGGVVPIHGPWSRSIENLASKVEA